MFQAVDLFTTYLAISSGRAREGNVFLRAFIHTPIAPVLKSFALVFLALLIVGSLTRGRPAPRRLMVVLWITCAAYAVITLNNVYILLTP